MRVRKKNSSFAPSYFLTSYFLVSCSYFLLLSYSLKLNFFAREGSVASLSVTSVFCLMSSSS